MALSDYLTPRRITTSLSASGKPEAIAAMAQLLVEDPEGAELDVAAIAEILEAREALASTGVGSGVAIPHGRVAGLSHVRAALGIARNGVPFDAIDGEPVTVIVAILAPEEQRRQHLRILADVSRVLRRPDFRRRLALVSSPEEAFAVVQESA